MFLHLEPLVVCLLVVVCLLFVGLLVAICSSCKCPVHCNSNSLNSSCKQGCLNVPKLQQCLNVMVGKRKVPRRCMHCLLQHSQAVVHAAFALFPANITACADACNQSAGGAADDFDGFSVMRHTADGIDALLLITMLGSVECVCILRSR